jgi:mRNA-degrading endonuclease RelE of RelBE toxin-antitoxin system
MNKHYVFEYFNENEFKKLERSVKKYNMLAYKKLAFEYYPALKEGKSVGKLVSMNSKEKTKTFELKLPTDDMFAKVHGDMKLIYTIYEEKQVVLLVTITPEDILSEGHRTELTTCNGVIISKNNAERDMFKINLLKMLDR